MKVPPTGEVKSELDQHYRAGVKLRWKIMICGQLNAGLGLINLLNLWATDYEWQYILVAAVNFGCAALMLFYERKLQKHLKASRTLKECVDSLENMGERAFTPEGMVYAHHLIDQAEAAYQTLTGEVLFKDGWREEMEP